MNEGRAVINETVSPNRHKQAIGEKYNRKIAFPLMWQVLQRWAGMQFSVSIIQKRGNMLKFLKNVLVAK